MSYEYDYEQRRIYKEWAAHQIGIDQFRSDATTIAVLKEKQIIGVTVFDTFSPGECQVHVASDGSRRWLTRDYLRMVFAYPFVQLQFRRVTSLVPETNTASARFCAHTGFREEGRLREAGLHGEDLIVFGMLRRECRWLTSSLINL
ncbi:MULTISPECIES: GNAT family protein [unclassified Brucella]|uniref:GNAT family N-acetyltransferase n=1 Tax=unclassified Brucella TaxID=2632610 RepID=UPI0012AD7E5F|nr:MULTISPECIES: GNAT family protein [unclassified Brucella]MRN43474.1 N-acetyltransferase [Brucella sp. 09RB8913]MRN59449.1 N-acetyltransferase [Brucella sp. 09RB8918]MRN67956.1 N-acetyltransferase [Brucella sp. 10RB9213]